MVARAMCVMYYGRSCSWNGNEAGCCTETAWNDHSVVQPITVNFLMTLYCTYGITYLSPSHNSFIHMTYVCSILYDLVCT